MRAVTTGLALTVLVAATLSACASAPKPPPPPELDLTISAGPAQNPETNGKPAPVVIKLYQLAATGGFARADVYDLTTNEAKLLGQDLLASESLELNPGETQKIRRQLKPGAQFLGAAVLFRDIDNAAWRASAPLAANGLTALTLKTARLSMTLGAP